MPLARHIHDLHCHGFFAANMERKLRLLFAPLNEWSLDYDFDLGEFILFPVVDEIAVIQ